MASLKEAIKYPFSQAGWKKKVGIIFLLFFIITTLTLIGSLFTDVPRELIKRNIIEENSLLIFLSFIGTIISFVASMLSIPIEIYSSGYKLSNIKSIMEGDEVIPVHTKIFDKLLLGLMPVFTRFVYNSLALLSLIISVFYIVYAYASSSGGSPSALGWIVFSLSLFWLLVIYPFIERAALFGYLSTGKFIELVHVINIAKRMVKYFNKFLILYLLDMLLFFASVLIFISTILFIMFSIPALQTMYQYISAYLTGNIYKEILNIEK